MKILLFLLGLSAVSYGYKAVFFVPEMAKSQILFNTRVAETLAKAGHNVTLLMVSPFKDADPNPLKFPSNLRIKHVVADVGVSRAQLEEMQGQNIFEEASFFDSKTRADLKKKLGFITQGCKVLIQNKEIIKWVEDEKFDIAFPHMYDLCGLGIIHQTKIPTWIWVNSGKIMDYVANLVGVPIIPSYVSPMLMEAHDVLTFTERMKSFIGHTLMQIIWPTTIANPETEMFREEFGQDFPHLMDIAKKSPLVFVNSHDVYGLASPTLAKVVNIGGVGMEKKKSSPLPKEFEEIVQKGKGTIIMTFGSIAPAHKMPESWKTALLGAFRRFPDYQFIIRYLGSDINDRLPSNVHLFKWIPQSDLLQHPKVRALITHGGYNSMQEAISSGKPLIPIPLFGDQPKNAKIAEKLGLAVSISKSEMSEEAVYNAVNKICTDKSYSEKAMQLSGMVDNYPLDPAQQIVKWSNFVAKYKTLDNLEPVGIHLSTFTYFSLDVISVIILTISFVLFLVYCLIRSFLRCICKKCGQKKPKSD